MATLPTFRNGHTALPLGIILLALLFLFLAVAASQQRDAQWREQLFNEARRDLSVLEQARQAMRGEARIAVYSLSQDPDVLRLIRRTNTLIREHGRAHPEVLRLRAQLAEDLDGFWQLLRQAGAEELQVNLIEDRSTLLRMRERDVWGDQHDEGNPLNQLVIDDPAIRSGLTLHYDNASESAVAPLLADNRPDSPLIATLQVSFPALVDGPIDRSEGLSLLLEADSVPAGSLKHSMPLLGQGRWLQVEKHGAAMPPGVSDALGTLDQRTPERLYSNSDGTWLLSLLPLEAVADEQPADTPAPTALVLWRDISTQAAAHLREQRQLAGKWLLALVAACALFSLLQLSSYRAARRQVLRHADAIREESQKREHNRRLLEIIARTQSAYIQQNQMQVSLHEVLEQILALTGYQVGLLSQSRLEPDGTQTLQLQSSLDTRPHPEPAPRTLVDAMNASSSDQQARLIASGNPELHGAALLPLLFGGRLMGMLALSHGPDEAGPALLTFLAPLQTSLGQLLNAMRQREEHTALQERLERQRLALGSLNRIAADFGLSHQERLKRLLDLGCDYLQLDLGLVSRISGSTYEVIAASSGENSPESGACFDFEQTYCNLTYQHDDVMVIDSMGNSRFNGHPCYRTFALECYIGVALIVGNRRYGTLNFSASAPRARPFDEVDLDFMRLCARWCSGLLEQQAEQQAREALLQRFAKLNQHLPGMVYQYQLSSDGHSWFPFSSEGIGNIYDLTPEQAGIDARPAIELIHPEDHDRIVAEIGESARQLTEWRSEYRVRHPRLGEIWVAGYASPEPLANGDIVWHGFIADITTRKHIEQHLASEQQRLARIIDATGVGSWEWDMSAEQLEVNPRWLQMLGLPADKPQSIPAASWSELIHPDDRESARAQLLAHLRGDTDHLRYVCRARHQDGHWVWIQSHGQVSRRDASGRALWMSGIHTDISQEMAAAEEVREARAFLSAVIKASTEVAVIVVNTRGSITLFNTGAEKLLGYRAEEMVGQQTPICFHLSSEIEQRSQELSAHYGKPIDGLEVFLHEARQGGSETRSWTYRRKDGQERQVNLTVTRIADEHGEAVGYLGMATDITDLAEATRALQQSESRFRSMVSNLPGAVYRRRPDHQLSMSYLSNEIEHITGYPAVDLVDNRRRSYASIVHPDDLSALRERIQGTRSEPTFELTYRLIHANGQIVQVREKGRAEFAADDSLIGFDGFIWDVTEQIRIEQMKAQFVSTVSHELRTPLTAISGALKLIHGGALGTIPENMRRLLGIAVQNSDNLHSLINDLLDMDKLTAGQLQIQLQDQPLRPLLEQALELNQSYADQFQVTQLLDPIDDVVVSVDRQRFGQILANLLSNAAKFSRRQGRIWLGAQYLGDQVEISVRDEGIGIPSTEHERIFDKFFQVDSTSTRSRTGSGLGLAITRELARRMAGEVGFESSEGVGSRFWVRLPCKNPNAYRETV